MFPPSPDRGSIEGSALRAECGVKTPFSPSSDGGFSEGRQLFGRVTMGSGCFRHLQMSASLRAPFRRSVQLGKERCPPSSDCGFIEGSELMATIEDAIWFRPSSEGGLIEGVGPGFWSLRAHNVSIISRWWLN